MATEQRKNRWLTSYFVLQKEMKYKIIEIKMEGKL